MAENEQEKTDQSSDRKREQAYKDGNFPVSRELSSFFIIAGMILILYFTGVTVYKHSAEIMKMSFNVTTEELRPEDVGRIFWGFAYKFFELIIPVLFIPLLGAAAYGVQTGFRFSSKPLEPDLSKIDPVSGTKKLLSGTAIVEVVKSILKITVLGYVVYTTAVKEWHKMPFLMNVEVVSSLGYMAELTFAVMVKTVWVLAVIAVIDYGFNRWKFEKSLKMTREEMKEEAKESEGDPAVKARIRSIQRDLARKRMMQAVPTADVVVTNPTHIAVALKYDREKADAPLVVAKGAGVIAEKIKEIARKNRVPVIENKPLARAIFKEVDLGREIPASLYKAVAEILAYVYRLKNRVRR